MSDPLISIVIVAYNAGNTIAAAIESILDQSWKNAEVLVIDGGSTDNSLEVIGRYSSRLGYFISEKDKGVYDAMNKGVAAAKGDWILFLGADDVLYSNETLHNIFSGKDLSGHDFIYGDVEFTTNRQRYGGEKTYTMLVDKNICHQAIFHNKRLFHKLGNFSLAYKVLGDFDMNIRAFRDPSVSKHYIPVIVSLFNNKGMSSRVLDKNFHTDMLRLSLNTDKVPFLAPQLQQHHFYHGIISLYSKKFGQACKHIPASWISGKRKLFYFLFTFKFILRTLTGDKIIIK